MHGEYIDHTEYPGIEPDDVNRILKGTDWAAYDKWWAEKNLPMGLDLIELHGHINARDYCVELCKRYDIENPTEEDLLKMAITVDAMIS